MMLCDPNSALLDYNQISQGDYYKFEKELLNIFNRQFIQEKINLNGKRVLSGNSYQNSLNTFYHIISTTQLDNNRVLDTKRSERIHWLKPLIEKQNCNQCPKWLIWEKEHNGKETRTYIFCEDLRFLIVLKNTNSAYILVTSYYIEHNYKIEELKKEYNIYK